MSTAVNGAAGDLRGRAVRGGALSMGSQLVKLVVQIGTTAVLARLLSPSEFGLVAMVIPFVTFLQLLQDAGLASITVQRPDITSEQVGVLFWTNVAVAAVLTVLLMLMAPAIAAFYGDPRLTPIAIAFAALLVPAASSVQHRALLQRALNFRVLVAIDIGMQLAATAVSISMAWAGFGPWALVGHTAALTLAQIPLLWIVHPWRPGRPRGFAGARELIRSGSQIAGYNLLNFLARNVDNVLIGKVWGDAAVGLYGRAFNLMLTPIWQINAPLGAVALPMLSRLADQPARYRSAYRQVLEKLLLLTVPGIAVLVTASDAVVTVLFGRQWLEAAPILSALGVAALVQPVNFSTNWLFVSQGRSADLLRWGLVSAPVQIAGILIGLPWGPMGVAVGFAATNVLVLTPLLWWRVGSGHFSAGDLARTVLPFAIGAALTALALLLTRPLQAGLHPLLLLAAAGAVSYLIQLLVLLALPGHRRVVVDVLTLGLSLLRGRGVRGAKSPSGSYR